MVGIVVAVIVFIALIYVFHRIMDGKYLRRQFNLGNTITFGLRGRGKDMIFEYIISKNLRKHKSYISNVDYTGGVRYYPFEAEKLDINNDRQNFVSRDIRYYEFPYPQGTDIYLSDCGVYYPSYDNNKLSKEYPRVPLFNALSRHVGHCNVHCNIQNINRLWITYREQADIYIEARRCRVWFGKFVHLKCRVYDRYDSAVRGVDPFPYKTTSLNKEKRMRAAEFQANNGTIKNLSIWFKLKYKYDDTIFGTMLRNGV